MKWPFARALSLGERGERAAVWRLRREGFRIVARNVRIGRYELDIIAREGDTLAFVEVKTRMAGSVAEPEDSVTPTKQRHIKAAARAYIDRNEPRDIERYYRFDIVGVVYPPSGKPEITLYRNAFPGD